MKMSSNPYFNRRPISSPQSFIGRKSILRAAFSALASNPVQCYAIYGERRIGKTSILLQVLNAQQQEEHSLNREDLILVWVDFSDEQPETDSDLFNTLHYCLCQQIERMHGVDVSCRTESERYRKMVEEGQSSNLWQFKRQLREHLEALTERGWTTVFVIDEADAAFLKPEVKEAEASMALRAWVNAPSLSVGFLIASKLDLAVICEENQSSPWYNVFITIKSVGLFSAEEALELIERPSTDADVEFTQQDKEFILRMAGRHPYLLQIACYHVFQAHQVGGLIEHDRLETEISHEYRRFFDYLWNGLDAVDQATLHQIATLSAPEPQRFDESDLKRLEDRCYLEPGSTSHPRLFSRSFARFVRDRKLTPVRAVLQSIEHPLRRRVWESVEQVETNLRLLIEDRLGDIHVDNTENYLMKRYPNIYERWFDLQERDAQKYGEQHSYFSTIFDYSYMEDLRQLVESEWQTFRPVFGSGREKKQEFNRHVRSIIGVRNSLAHFRYVPDIELMEAEVACSRLLEVLPNSNVQ